MVKGDELGRRSNVIIDVMGAAAVGRCCVLSNFCACVIGMRLEGVLSRSIKQISP